MVSRNSRLFFRRSRPAAFAALLFLVLAGLCPATIFEFKPLTPQRVNGLSKEARQEYNLGHAAIDKVNYDAAIKHFLKATEIDPDNPWLRFCIVQIASYLGETRRATRSAYDKEETYSAIEAYDLAASNLKAIMQSPKLNAREQQRAQQWLETTTALRQSALERDAKRMQHGWEIAKQYNKEIYHKDQADQEKAAKEGRLKPGQGPVAVGSKALSGEKRDLRNSYSEPESATTSPAEQPNSLRKEPAINSGENTNLKNPSPATP